MTKNQYSKRFLKIVTIIFGVTLITACHPETNAGKNQKVESNALITLDGSASKPHKKGWKWQIHSYQWERVDIPNYPDDDNINIDIENANKALATFISPNNVGLDLSFKLTVTNNKGKSSSDLVTISINKAVNIAPVAIIKQTSIKPTLIEVDSSQSYDPDGYIINRHWKTDHPLFATIADSSATLTQISVPFPLDYIPIETTLTVFDDRGDSSTAQKSLNFTSTTIDSADVSFSTDPMKEKADSTFSIYQGADVLYQDIDIKEANSIISQLPINHSYVAKINTQGFTTQVIPFTITSTKDTLEFGVKQLSSERFEHTLRQDLFAPETNDGTALKIRLSNLNPVEEFPIFHVKADISSINLSSKNSQSYLPGKLPKAQDGQLPTLLSAAQFYLYYDNKTLSLADNKSAEVELPIYPLQYIDGMPITVGDEVQIWHLNDENGNWETTGETTLVIANSSATGKGVKFNTPKLGWLAVTKATPSAEVKVNLPTQFNSIAQLRMSTNKGPAYYSQNNLSTSEESTLLEVPAETSNCISATFKHDNGSRYSTEKQCLQTEIDSLNTLTLSEASDEPIAVLVSEKAVTDEPIRLSLIQGKTINAISLAPASIEVQMSYIIVKGGIPIGLKIHQFNTTHAEINGIPEKQGDVTAVIEAKDREGNTKRFPIIFSVTPAP